MKFKNICLLPTPSELRQTGGVLTDPLRADLPASLACLSAPLKALWPALLTAGEASVTFVRDAALAQEGYSLLVAKTGVEVGYAAGQGAFYALMTLRQLDMQFPGELPCCVIEDAPALPLRGVMLDVSRGKVPTLATLEEIADRLASFKINHLQLYFEGFSFAYPSFPDFWKDQTPLTPDEIRSFDAYCKARFIDLVPSQNCLGHMAAWLAQEEYKSLAESEEGLEVMGMRFPCTTLNARDPRSLELVSRLTDNLAPSFTSRYFNVALDEPFELGKGKNKGESPDALYLEYAAKVSQIVAQKGRVMMMWGDVVGRDESLAAQLPKGTVVLDWGYDAEYPVEKRAAALQKAGLRFCLCPGTNSWSSFTGLTDNMITCVRRAGEAAHLYGAEGLVVTDWGDMGHSQYLPVMWPGILLAAAYAWGRAGADEDCLADALNRFVFMDDAEEMGALCLDAGRYSALEEFRMPCRALAVTVLMSGIVPKEQYEALLEKLAKSVSFFSPKEVCDEYLASYDARKPFDGEALTAFFGAISTRLARSRMRCADGELVKREYENALRMLGVLTRVRGKIVTGEADEALVRDIDALINEHRALWRARSKEGGLENGITPFARLRAQLE